MTTYRNTIAENIMSHVCRENEVHVPRNVAELVLLRWGPTRRVE